MKFKISGLAYLVVALVGIYFLTKLWIPSGYIVAGHDSGLALNAGEFLKTRFFAWDDRIDFGSDNSPHFGSIILHSIDYLISILAKVPYAGSQLAVFLWIAGIFVFAFIFSYSLKEKFGKYFAFLFPVFLTFNFFIFQSIFILERAKYEIIFSTLLLLTLIFRIFLKEGVSVLKYSIIFSLALTLFNAGSWFGLPLYGGLIVVSAVTFVFALALSFKNKNFTFFKKILIFFSLNTVFYLLLNSYSLLPYLYTLKNLDFAKVINQGTIAAGYEWLNYISRGSSFLNLFRLQGIPDWYLTGYLPNTDHAYAGFYLTKNIPIFISFLFPIVAFLGLLIPPKEKVEKYIVSFFIFLLLVSMFFVSGTNSPLGFIYEFLYTKIPGFNIFRSPYYKFAPAYLIPFCFLLSYSLSKIIKSVSLKIKVRGAICEFVLFLFVILGWFAYHKIIFNSKDLFFWQPGKSTLVRVPDHVNEFGNWLNNTDIKGRILMVPPFDKTWRDDAYNWGYWSLSALPSLLSKNASFVANDIGINSGEEGWINELYTLLSNKDSENFVKVSSQLGIRYVFLKRDYSNDNDSVQNAYSDIINRFVKNGNFTLIKSIGPWSVFSITNVGNDDTFKLTDNVFSIPGTQSYLENQLLSKDYSGGLWVDATDIGGDLEKTLKKKFYPLNCESCRVENLGKYADIPVVRILPNSPLYQIKQRINNKSILEAKDDNSKAGVYLGLVMIKLSEVRSMYQLKTEKEFIDRGLKDMSLYLQAIEDIFSRSPSTTQNFYLASLVYETLNPVQRYLRDYVSSSDYNSEKQFIRDDILKILWQSMSIKKLFDPIVAQEERWSSEKFYNLNLPRGSTYNFLIDSETLPFGLDGNYIKPSKILLDGEGDDKVKLENIVDERFLATNSVAVAKDGGIHLYFSNLPNLFELKGWKTLDFPEGSKGCLEGTINYFTKSRMYRFKISSAKYSDSLRLYVKEKSGDNILSTNGFLREDIGVDITTFFGQKPFEYIYAPRTDSDNPRVLLCRRDGSLPQEADIKVSEIFSPIVYAVYSSGASALDDQTVFHEKLNPTKYKVSFGNVDRDSVLVFNSRFSTLWKLYDSNTGGVMDDHFVVDGYANGWLIKKGDQRNFSLVYQPQIWFEKGRIISVFFLSTTVLIYIWLGYFKKRKQK